MIYRSETAGRHAYAALLKALDEERLDPALVIAASERSRQLKKDVLLPYKPVAIQEVGKVVGCTEHLATAQKFESPT
jgi:hypothetical protein